LHVACDMGKYNSSETRVRPVINALLDDTPWLSATCRAAASTRPDVDVRAPLRLGRLLPDETPTNPEQRLGKVFERVVPPPAAFLKWLLENPDRMQVDDTTNYGATSESAREWRRKLFSSDPALRSDAQREGLARLAERGSAGSSHAWWAFEGFTNVDCCLITEHAVIFIEGKRMETVSASTRWFAQRSQLWRNVEAAAQFADAKDFTVILAVEHPHEGTGALVEAERTLNDSYPHLSPERRTDLSRHLLGFVSWPDIVERFGLPAECLLGEIARQT
jgi:hypothetical protein